MAALIARVGPCRFEVASGQHPFEALVESIVYQQITGRAAARIHERLVGLLGRKRPRPEDILAVSLPALRGVGLSRQKAAYLRDLSARVSDGRLPLSGLSRKPDEAIIESLIAVKGIGRWTAHMFLMFRMGRPDVLPVGDYGVRKAMQRAYRMRLLPKPRRMERVAAPWRPYRTVASWYLWRSLDIADGRA